MGWLIARLAGAAGPYILGGVVALVLALSVTAGVQTMRLNHTKADLTSARSDLKAARTALDGARTAIRARDDQIRANAAQAASEAGELADALRLTCKGAFNAGYASRRCSDPGAADGGVLPDLRQAQLVGAFRASGGVSAEPGGTHR